MSWLSFTHIAILAVALRPAAVLGGSAGGARPQRTLVLLDNWTIKETHSIFFKSLRGQCMPAGFRLAT